MKKLNAQEEQIILHKGTEAPFSGKFYKHHADGSYVCRQCGAPLYRSEDKFDSGCGWPSFDQEIPGAVKRTPDADGLRTEITCARCGGHLGHVFEGEGLTPKNTRHCVNSVSLDFVPAGPNEAVPAKPQEETAVFAGGCFWGVEHLMKTAPGVTGVQSGYTGGSVPNPTYEQVSSGQTGHLEAVLVTFDPSKTNYETLAKLFFEIHDPTQQDGQGPDVGAQYRSAVFYADDKQKQTALKLIKQLENKGYKIATKILPRQTFWPAEEYHQNYYERKGTQPYCHARVKRFD